MVIISDIFVFSTKGCVMTKVKTWFVIETLPKALRRNGNRCNEQKNKQ